MKHYVLLVLLLMTGAARADDQRTYSDFPTGQGDPDAITCRPPQPLPHSRLNGPEVCKVNSFWAMYRRDGMDIAPDGIHDVPLRKNSGISCQANAMPGGANWTGRTDLRCNRDR